MNLFHNSTMFKRARGKHLSYEKRPKEIEKRQEFGHWECDLVLGHKTKDDEVLLTLCERMSREFLIIRIPDKTPTSIMQAFEALPNNYQEQFKND